MMLQVINSTLTTVDGYKIDAIDASIFIDRVNLQGFIEGDPIGSTIDIDLDTWDLIIAEIKRVRV